MAWVYPLAVPPVPSTAFLRMPPQRSLSSPSREEKFDVVLKESVPFCQDLCSLGSLLCLEAQVPSLGLLGAKL